MAKWKVCDLPTKATRITEDYLYGLIREYRHDPNKRMDKAFWLLDRHSLKDIRLMKDGTGNYLCSFNTDKHWTLIGIKVVIRSHAAGIKLTDFLDT